MKTISETLTKDGPCYVKTRMALLEWLNIYKKRNQPGDINVVKFLEHFLEVQENDK